MYDLHYDLLTNIYINKNNILEVKKYLKKLFRNNISGGIFNLFYMSPKEMKEELNIEEKEIDIIKNLEEVKKIIRKNKLIPKNIKYIYGIEGLDYLYNIKDLEQMYQYGVRTVNIVWNNDNQFGGGSRGNQNRGLTNIGTKLIKKLVDKNIAIDVSHSNEKTCNNILELCQKLKTIGKEPIVFASHSNVKSLYDHPRNLTDEQIIKIKQLDGVIGIVGVKIFCENQNDNIKNKNFYKQEYIKNIIYIKKLLGGVDNIAISTDDMTYYKIDEEYYKEFNVFCQINLKKEVQTLLKENDFTKKEIEKILYKNFENKILKKL